MNFPSTSEIAQEMRRVAVETGTIGSFPDDEVRLCAADSSAEVQKKFADTVLAVRQLIACGVTPEGIHARFILMFRQEYEKTLLRNQRPLVVKVLRNSALTLLALRAAQDEQRAAQKSQKK